MSGRRLRLPLVLVAVVLVGFVAGDPDPLRRAASPAAVDVAAVPPPGTPSAAWFCAGAPADRVAADQVLGVANLAPGTTRVAITVHPDDGSDPVAREVDLDPLSVTPFARGDLGPPGGVVVESFGGEVVVESGFSSGAELATDACATAAAADWYFAAGTTVRGVEQYLVLYNPLGSDAKVDVTLRTNRGVDTPESLRGYDVPRRSRRVVAVHEHAVRLDRVAVDVHAAVGRVVATQLVRFTPSSGFSGLAMSRGALAPSDTWTFATGAATAGTATVLALSNPGVVDAEVDLLVDAGAETPVPPVTVRVPGEGVAWVRLGRCGDGGGDCVAVPAGARYALTASTGPDAPVVAELLVRSSGPDGAGGAAVVTGAAAPASRWVVPRARAGATSSLALANLGAGALTVEVAVVSGGARSTPAGLEAFELAPGERRSIATTDVVPADAAVVVSASAPVTAEWVERAGTDLTRAGAVPRREDAP